MDIMKKIISVLTGKKLSHTRLPKVVLGRNNEPLDFVGSQIRNGEMVGFVDDRVRTAGGYVEYAPRKIIPDLLGGGVLVSENYPISAAIKKDPSTLEANVPRQTRGQKADTLTEIHDKRTKFDVAVASFPDTQDNRPPKGSASAWKGSSNPTTEQPSNPFNPRYPYNHVRLTESGHLFESDDTPGAERIKESHRVGTYYEIFPDGSKVTKIVRDNFTVVVGHNQVNIQGSAIVTIEGDCNFLTKGDFTHQVDGNYNLLVKGDYTERVAGEVTLNHHSDVYHNIGKPIDLTKVGSGRGNNGGDHKVKVYGDRKLEVMGSSTEVCGDPDTYDSSGATVVSQKVVFGDQKTQIVGGFLYEQVEKNKTEIVGKNKTSKITGNHTTDVNGNSTESVGGNASEDIAGTNTIVSGGKTELTAGTVEIITGAFEVTEI